MNVPASLRIARNALTAALAAATLCAMHVAAQTTYTFDGSNSSIQISVYKEGLFSAFAHNHLIAAKDFSGSVQFDANQIANSSVALRVAANSLTVVDPGESDKDRKQVQATMLGGQVLDAARYPGISFHSTGVTKVQKQGSGWRVTLAGDLQLHGVQKAVTLPLSVRLESGELVAQGEVFLLQTDYGITPVRIAGGAVKVKDRIRIRFEVHAHS